MGVLTMAKPSAFGGIVLVVRWFEVVGIRMEGLVCRAMAYDGILGGGNVRAAEYVEWDGLLW